MGCLLSTESKPREKPPSSERVTGLATTSLPKGKPTKDWGRPKWKSDEPLTTEKVNTMRSEFWDTQPHYGGSREIWDALKGACEVPDKQSKAQLSHFCRDIWDALKASCEMPDKDTSKLIIESAGIIVAAPDMTLCYDERDREFDAEECC
eukprot:gene25193-biopygen19656